MKRILDMQMFYKIEFNNTNEYFINLIQEQIFEDKINIQIKKYEKFIILHINDSEEKITEFFQNLEKNLPLSIFLKGASFIEKIPEELKELSLDNLQQNISLSNKEILKLVENRTVDFTNEIKQLKEGKIIELSTSNGIKKFSLPNKENRIKLEEENEVNLFVSNINAISSLLECSSKDLQLLCSIERPLVKLKFNFLQNKDLQYSCISFIYTKLPDDKLTFEFALALKEEGIDFLIYSDFNVTQKDIQVTYFKDENIIIRGDKTLFPKYDIQDKKVYNSSDEFFCLNGGIYKTIIKKENKRSSNSIGVYFSYNSEESKISLNLPTKGIKDIVYIPNIENSISSCMEDIASMDENTARLVENYKKKFPLYFKKDLDQNTNGFVSILNFIAVMLGMKDYKEFESYAHSYNSKSGIQIDMKLFKYKDKNYLDYRKIAHSIFSYKLADVDNALLAFSFYESLSEFIKNSIEEINKDIESKNIILCGDIIVNSILLSKLDKELSNNFTLVIPKNYPIDY
ncbi:Kae1-like domain-containing protein [Malaciobacter mytili]|uniref:Kae1-like domain-containing protein n=1 Tax=Malaciobacter mytili TaxID=603050 RepID=UPI001D18DFA2|nr:hypothetical protein [Malaciobacter mytili]